jgi:hypothetical protein
MAKVTWKFLRVTGSVNLTTDVMSFSRFRGKQQYLDNYTGQTMTVTIRNNTNQSASWVVGEAYNISLTDGRDLQTFWVNEVQYNDQQGTTTTSGSGSASTATVILQDWIGRAGQIQLTSFTLTQDETYDQIVNQITVASGALPSNMGYYSGTAGTFNAAAATYTGTIANRINLNLAGEAAGSQIYQQENQLFLRPGESALNGSEVTLQPSKGASTGNYFLVYQNFKRITAGQNFINTVTVTPPVAAAQTATDASSVTTYGTRFNGVSTVNTTTSQALSRAQWLANSQSDPYALRFEVSFSDVVQDNDGIGVMLQQYLSNAIIYLKYVVPGSGVTTTTTCNIEGIRYSASADQTLLTMFLSPSAMYAEFRLDSTAFGVLNQNRLGVKA